MSTIGDIDAIVNDARWQPYRGWWDDYDDIPMPAIQQHRAEFVELVVMIEEQGLRGGKCLQLGLGTPGASHCVLEHLFDEAWSVDIARETIADHLARSPGSKNVMRADTRLERTVESFRQRAPFDFLFIDADHREGFVQWDYMMYGPLVRDGGMIAFHDTIYRPPYDEGNTMWKFIERLAPMVDMRMIGNVLGIGVMVKSGAICSPPP